MRTVRTVVLGLGLAAAGAAAWAGEPIVERGVGPVVGPVVEPALKAAPWWHEAVFYEVFVRSFADSQTGPLANDGVGDFAGLTARLDYLNDADPDTDTDLGVTALWLMPVAESPSYHGYDVTDYRAVDREYGTAADFRAFIDACQARGIRVIVDLVLNHCSSRHPWFVEAVQDPASPKRDWFVWSQEDPGFRGPWNQTVWHGRTREQTGLYYYGCFNHDMPDLNLANPDLTAELKAIARFWIEEMGVDGFRLDAIKHLIQDGPVQENTPATIDWLEDFQAYCRSLDSEFFSVGEVWAPTEQVRRYIPDAVDTAFEFDLAQAILDAVNAGDATGLEARLVTVLGAYEAPVATFLTNHDQARVMTQLGGDIDKARAAASVLLTLPGVPFLYYGEEIGISGDKPDPNIRTPMQWTAKASGFTRGTAWREPQEDAAASNLASQRGRPGSLFEHYRRLIAMRRASGALSTGRTVLLDPQEPGLLAFVRESEAGATRTLVVVNLSGTPLGWYQIELDRPAGAGEVREIGGNRRPFGSLSDDGAIFRGGGIRGHELFVLELPGG
jgi:glycosidase